MYTAITTEPLPVKLWLSELEPGALEQVRHLARLPSAFRHVAVMPDAHQGYGMPIGGVLACRGVIIPNAVGVDIGCGMCARRTSLRNIDMRVLKRIIADIRTAVPVGFKWHKKPCDEALMPSLPDDATVPVAREEFFNARHQAGTLGGGNHFIEIQKGSDGFIWLMVHSGSRNIGKKVADRYNRIAVDNAGRWGSQVPKEWQLAHLPLDTDEARAYRAEMGYCVAFAFFNRKLMMERVRECVTAHVPECRFEPFIYIAHNFAAEEEHFGETVMVHRKGATRAFRDEYGIIPGSQGTESHIVRGLGNPESFMSCSHGAGRRMGRKQAVRSLDLKAERKTLEERGILHSLRGKSDLDEAPGAYKDIRTVMEQQRDLVESVVRLRPLAVVKG